MKLNAKGRRELLGLLALAVGAFVGLPLLPWRVTGAVGSWLGTALWTAFGVGALLFPTLGATLALAAFQRFTRLSVWKATGLAATAGLLIPYTIGVVVDDKSRRSRLKQSRRTVDE